MAGYGWDEYDVRTGGRQTVHDAGNMIDISTEFVKVPGGDNGGNWAVRIKGTPREDAPPDLKSTVIFYTGLEGFGSLEVDDEDEELGYTDAVNFNGQTSELGNFKIEVTRGPESNNYPHSSHPAYAEKPLDRTFVGSLQLTPETLWQTKCTSRPVQ
jgi:mannosyl-oligosaccharide glucosidase